MLSHADLATRRCREAQHKTRCRPNAGFLKDGLLMGERKPSTWHLTLRGAPANGSTFKGTAQDSRRRLEQMCPHETPACEQARVHC